MITRRREHLSGKVAEIKYTFSPLATSHYLDNLGEHGVFAQSCLRFFVSVPAQQAIFDSLDEYCDLMSMEARLPLVLIGEDGK